ncbi:MAG: PHA/PHB synthase family protein [Hyphomonas sp.]
MSKSNDKSTPPRSLSDLMQGIDPTRFQTIMTTLALANTESQALLADVLAGSGPIGTMYDGDPMGANEAFKAVGQSLATHPAALMAANMQLMQGWMGLWQEMSTEALTGTSLRDKDKRFSDPEWSQNPAFRFIEKAYHLNSNWLAALPDMAPDLPENLRQRAKFFSQQVTETLSPTNFLSTNPQALRVFLETGGDSVLRGIRMAREDIRNAGGKLQISQTDTRPFEVGKNIATAPGQVVFRNDLIELIQYKPTQETVYSRPLLIFPPWINKFYILDLREENSMIRWLVDQGLTVFVVSWRSADAETADYTWDDYAQRGIYAAVTAALQAANTKKLNAVGYCIGGTLLSMTMARMAQEGDKRIASATFFASQSDFELAGDLKVFTDAPARKFIDQLIDDNGGVMPGSMMFETFNWLRPIDLVWRYVIDQYMLGKPARPFDLLYWNGDQTNIPGPVHRTYLHDLYAENTLANDEFILLGDKVRLKDVTAPIMIQASKDDHICPFESVFKTTKLFGGETEFILAGSGHIAGVVNHPDAKKYQHWTNTASDCPTSADWFDGATEHAGSWWPTWWKWLRPKSGKKQPALEPQDMGLGAAPGRYVKTKLDDISLPIKR